MHLVALMTCMAPAIKVIMAMMPAFFTKPPGRASRAVQGPTGVWSM